MMDVLNLALPYFGLIFIGFACGKLKSLPEAGLAWLKGNTEGWANFLACLKAYVEHGINLRKGAFDYRFTTS